MSSTLESGITAINSVELASHAPTLYAKVETYQSGLEQPIRSRTINFRSPEHRSWLVNHMMWALHQNHEVLVYLRD